MRTRDRSRPLARRPVPVRALPGPLGPLGQPGHPGRLVLLMLLTVLAGCAPATEDLDAWTQQQRAAVRPDLPPLAEPPRFDPSAYASAQRDDPFDPRRIAAPDAPQPTAAERSTPTVSAAAAATQPLLTRPLEEMTLVGTLRSGTAARALVRVDGQVHTVAPGDGLGPNRGRLVRIDERRIEVREPVRAASGQWTERATMLLLQGDPK